MWYATLTNTRDGEAIACRAMATVREPKGCHNHKFTMSSPIHIAVYLFFFTKKDIHSFKIVEYIVQIYKQTHSIQVNSIQRQNAYKYDETIVSEILMLPDLQC
jgi:hypothetical protein